MSRWCLLAVCLVVLCGCGRSDPPDAPFAGYGTDGLALDSVVVPAQLPNLVVIVVDSLRHDAPMPFLDRLASEGVAFENAVSAAPWTLPSLTTMLTGLLPSHHGLTEMETRTRLPHSVTTFAEILSATYGYETAAFHHGPWFCRHAMSVLQAFQDAQGEFSMHAMRREVLHWANRRNPLRPFFLLLHTYDAHVP